MSSCGDRYCWARNSDSSTWAGFGRMAQTMINSVITVMKDPSDVLSAMLFMTPVSTALLMKVFMKQKVESSLPNEVQESHTAVVSSDSHGEGWNNGDSNIILYQGNQLAEKLSKSGMHVACQTISYENIVVKAMLATHSTVRKSGQGQREPPKPSGVSCGGENFGRNEEHDMEECRTGSVDKVTEGSVQAGHEVLRELCGCKPESKMNEACAHDSNGSIDVACVLNGMEILLKAVLVFAFVQGFNACIASSKAINEPAGETKLPSGDFGAINVDASAADENPEGDIGDESNSNKRRRRRGHRGRGGRGVRGGQEKATGEEAEVKYNVQENDTKKYSSEAPQNEESSDGHGRSELRMRRGGRRGRGRRGSRRGRGGGVERGGRGGRRTRGEDVGNM